MNKHFPELFTATVITAVLVIACFAADRFMPETPEEPVGATVAELRIRADEAVDFKVKEVVTPSPTPNPLPEGAVDLYVNDTTVLFTLESEEQAKAVLADYLNTGASSVPADEHLVSVSIDKKIRIIPATGLRALSTPEEVLAALAESPSLLPLTVVTEACTYETTPAESTSGETDALPKGLRFRPAIAADGRTLTVTEKTYTQGELIDSFVTDTRVIREKQDGSVLTGTWEGDADEAEPDKKQGVKGKDAGDLKLTIPIRVAVGSYFGFRNGTLHRGVDFPAKAGASVKTPAEGVVIYAGERGDYGNVVEIDHGNGFVSRLAHLDTISVVLNQRVFDGEVIATLADIEEEPLVLLPDPTPTPEATPATDAEASPEPEKEDTPYLHYELLIDGIPYNPMYYFE